MKKFAGLLLVFCLLFSAVGGARVSAAGDYIKWVNCQVSSNMLKEVVRADLKYHGSDIKFNIFEALSYLSMKNANIFNNEANDKKNLNKYVEMIKDGDNLDEFYADNKYYKYYRESYETIFKDLMIVKTAEENMSYEVNWRFPLARGFWFSHYDDFGSSRNYGFKRKHLGHDIMGGVGTPIIAVEGGLITELGWNRYGGWRIGITSEDGQRYFYYAHLRKDKPFAPGLKKGDKVAAGQHIGYLGNTGYSTKENQNLKTGNPHLHVGMQLIFDESQRTGNHEIWIDIYQICKFLEGYRAKV